MRKFVFLTLLFAMGYGSSVWAAPKKLVDPRDKKVYKTVEIDGSIWMAENLNYASKKSVCYEKNAENCDSFGRLYQFSEAKKVCPAGWHLPNNTELDRLVTLAERKDGAGNAGVHLKSRSGWFGTCDDDDMECRQASKNGFDTFGLGVKPSGRRNADGSFESIHNYGFFWSGTEAEFPYYFAVGFSYNYANVLYSGDYTGVHRDWLPVRCVKGDAPEEPDGWYPFAGRQEHYDEEY